MAVTKLRAPLTAQLALTRIAGVIGWDLCAEVTGRSPRTVQNWSDPDTSAGVTLDAAILLDLEYRAAGGDGSPLLEWHALRLDVELQATFASSEQLALKVAAAARESGEATAAGIVASRPGASDADLILAERETEEGIAAQTRTLAELRALRLGKGASLPGGAQA